MYTKPEIMALMETYTTLRAGYYSMREHYPTVAKMFAESAAGLLIAFPILKQLESFIRLGETELATGENDEGQKGNAKKLVEPEKSA